jgi:hypothetical protein
VEKGSQSIGAFAPIATKVYGVAPFRIVPPAATSKLGVAVTVKSGPATISGNIITITGVGTVRLAANLAVNENFNAAPEVTTTFSVTQATPFLGTFIVPSKLYGSEDLELTPPTSSSAGTWNYQSSSPTVATVSGSTVTIKGVGKTTITATQEANGNYTVASKTAVFTVMAATPTLGFFGVDSKVYGSSAFKLTAPASPSSGAWTYTSSVPGVATVTGSTVTIKGVGTTTIRATQAAKGNYTGASKTATFTVTAKL